VLNRKRGKCGHLVTLDVECSHSVPNGLLSDHWLFILILSIFTTRTFPTRLCQIRTIIQSHLFLRKQSYKQISNCLRHPLQILLRLSKDKAQNYLTCSHNWYNSHNIQNFWLLSYRDNKNFSSKILKIRTKQISLSILRELTSVKTALYKEKVIVAFDILSLCLLGLTRENRSEIGYKIKKTSQFFFKFEDENLYDDDNFLLCHEINSPIDSQPNNVSIVNYMNHVWCKYCFLPNNPNKTTLHI
jgi:hypothetical protein